MREIRTHGSEGGAGQANAPPLPLFLDIKALTPDGSKLDVKGVSRNGCITNIKAIAPDGIVTPVPLRPEQ